MNPYAILTQELVDILVPKHGRTSCSDSNICNGSGGWEGKYNTDTGKKEIRYPRCTRCYLLNNVGCKLSSMAFSLSVSLDYRQDYE